MHIRFSPQGRWAFVIACVVIVLGGVGLQAGANALNVYLRKEPVDLRRSLANLPATLGDWKLVEDYRVSEAAAEELGTELYVSRAYADPSGSVVNLHLAFYTGQIDVVPHVPDRCMVAGGLVERSPEPVQHALELDQSDWRIDGEHEIDGKPYLISETKDWLTGLTENVRMPAGDLVLRSSEFVDPKNPEHRIHAGYFFIANGRLTPNPGGVRLLAFNPAEQYAYYCKVQFTARGDSDFDEQMFLNQVTDMLDELMAEVMRCLPDWAEVQSSDPQSS